MNVVIILCRNVSYTYKTSYVGYEFLTYVFKHYYFQIKDIIFFLKIYNIVLLVAGAKFPY